jgi:hypothetical protein
MFDVMPCSVSADVYDSAEMSMVTGNPLTVRVAVPSPARNLPGPASYCTLPAASTRNWKAVIANGAFS